MWIHHCECRWADDLFEGINKDYQAGDKDDQLSMRIEQGKPWLLAKKSRKGPKEPNYFIKGRNP